MVSRSSMNSTSSLATSTSIILCDSRTIFSLLILIREPSPIVVKFFGAILNA
jgi:hypothetical protein